MPATWVSWTWSLNSPPAGAKNYFPNGPWCVPHPQPIALAGPVC
jgi:hypothetical protein